MGKKIEKVKETKNNAKLTDKSTSKNTNSQKTIEKKTNSDNKKSMKEKIQKENSNPEISNLNIQETKTNPEIITDKEELAILEDIKAQYQLKLLEIKEKLHLDQNLIKKAIKCIKTLILQKYENSNNILQNEQSEFFFLNFVLGKLPSKFSMRPVSVSIANSLYGSKFNTQVCIIVKDPRKTFKDLGLKAQLPFKLKVLDIEKLKLKFSRFHERRALLKDYELFLCDSKIYMMLKKLLGKPFYDSKKYPLPVKLDYERVEDIKNEIINYVEKTTTFYITHGPNYSIKIARVISSNEEILKNINDGINQTISHILKWGVDFEE